MAPRPTRRIGWLRIIGVAAVLALAGTLVSLARPSGAPQRATDVALLTSSDGIGDFDISGDVTNFTPGVGSRLTLTFTNPTAQSIAVLSVVVQVSSAPASCPASNLTLSGKTFTGTPPTAELTGLNVVVGAGGTASLNVAFMLARLAPNACNGGTFEFDYSGTAATPATAATATTLSTQPTTSRSGTRVTFNARVRSLALGTRLSGSVVFYRCAVALPAGSLASDCTGGNRVALSGSVPINALGQARFLYSLLPVGSDTLFAVFTASGTKVASSDSTTIIQTVRP